MQVQFQFRPQQPLEGFNAVHDVSFSFRSRAAGLGRAIALVGANGTGKTAILGALARGLSGLSPRTRARTLHGDTSALESVIAVSFSAFDTFRRPRQAVGVPYWYVGLRTRRDRLEQNFAFSDLAEHLESIQREGGWKDWVLRLDRMGVLDETPTRKSDLTKPSSMMRWVHTLSSGHKISVLILAALVARMQIGTIALLDEPELYLHPTLLSRLTRELHDLLELRQAFAIVATHSPLVLQSIPSEFVRVLEREGGTPYVRAYAGESFAENLTEIVNRVFGVSEGERNYVHLMRKALDELRGPQKVRNLLGPLSLNASLTLDSLQRERTGQ